MQNPLYLGDGVYAKFENSELMLWTDRQENGRNWLILGPAELSNLLAFLQATNGTELGPIEQPDPTGIATEATEN